LACGRYGKLDVLVNNAGIMPISPLDELRVDDWVAMVDVNIKGVLYGIAAALPVFREQGFGHFINTASTAAFRVTPSQSVYAGTKMAVRAISEGLRQEAGDRLRVTIISPGMTSTEFADSARTAPRRHRDATGRGRPGHRVRDRPASRCRRGRNRYPPDGTELGAPRAATSLRNRWCLSGFRESRWVAECTILARG
jgi:NAD(P)-dependent dehydrogenase (short-subunit alcohol dehydrogenase family)